jgi:hypothetical protein
MLRAIQVNLTDLRGELHGDYLNEAQMTNRFVTREELRTQARDRREWPLILAACVTTIAQLVTIALVLGGH